MTLKELSEYKKNLDELKAFRAFGMSPYQMELALKFGKIAQRQLTVFHQHGIWLDNVHLFQKVDEPLEAAPLPINLYTNDGSCVHCGDANDAEGSWVCSNCYQKGKNHV